MFSFPDIYHKDVTELLARAAPRGSICESRQLKRETAIAAAENILLSLPERRRRFIRWDLPSHLKSQGLAETLAAARHRVGFMLNEGAAGLAWDIPLCNNSRAAAIHFICKPLDPATVVRFGRDYLDIIRPTYDSVIGLIPRELYSARQIAVELGFSLAASLPGACVINGRPHDGCLYLKILNGKGSNNGQI